MKKLLFILSLLHITNVSLAQKRPVDETMYDRWPRLSDRQPVLSSDGKYVMYRLSRPQDSSGKMFSSLVIEATDQSWEREVPGGRSESMTGDSRTCLYMNPGDTLAIINLERNHLQTIAGAASYKIPEEGDGQWVAYLSATADKTLRLRDMVHGPERQFPAVVQYNFSNNGNALVLETIASNEKGVYFLLWIDLPSGKMDTVIKTDSKLENFVFDENASQLAFVEESKNQEKARRFYYFKPGMDSAITLVDGFTPGMEPTLIIGGEEFNPLSLPKFSEDGHKLFFLLRRAVDATDTLRSMSESSGRDIWNYKDRYLQTGQMNELNRDANSQYVAVMKIGEDRIFRLTNEGEYDWDTGLADEGNGDFLLDITRANSDASMEMNPKLAKKASIYLVSTRDGYHKLVKEGLTGSFNPALSPKGKYVIWYDWKEKNYFSYNVNNGVTRIITQSIPFPVYDDRDDHPGLIPSFPDRPYCWLSNDAAVLIYDRYDIWQVDPDGVKAPIDITNGYGRKHHIMLRYTYTYLNGAVSLSNQQSLLLIGFNPDNKYNGFFNLQLGKREDPQLLIMAPYMYALPQPALPSHVTFSFMPVKAKQAQAYIVRRMSATECPNLFFTKDFKNFTNLTDFHPQKEVNWLTAKLVHWKMSDGKIGSGILYKPEDFDIHKKYPVIFYYYERLTDRLNEFIYPEASNGVMNIPSFVSRGYLVFLPDIYYRIGYPAESVCNTVVSAAEYLSRMPWVDRSRMGLQGHSFGGYETNCIVTRSHLFAAAAEAAGMSDLVSFYGSIFPGTGGSFAHFTETGQTRLGLTLWEAPNLYIKNSPIFQADKISTPLFIMHNRNDGVVPWSQGVEWFTALRRLGKDVWMVQYDRGGHIIGNERDKLDYSIRLRQFFDHYLKGSLEPEWMKEGVPAKQRKIVMDYR